MATTESSIAPHIDPSAFWRQVHRCRHGNDCRRCCWPWRSTRAGHYGQIRIGPQRYAVHRLALELTEGAILLPGLLVCHTCDNPPCCNPHHLYPGTSTDNLRDRRLHGAYAPATRAGYAAADLEAVRAWVHATEYPGT